MALFQFCNSGEINRGIFSNGGMRATTGFHADDPVLRQNLLAHQGFGILLSIDVIGDDPNRKAF